MPLVQQAFGQFPANTTLGKLVLPARITAGNLVVFAGSLLSLDVDITDVTMAWEGGAPIGADGTLWNLGAFHDAGQVDLAGHYSTFSGAGLHTVEITTGTQGYLTVFAFEYAGVVSSPFDKQASATGTGTAAATGSTGTLSTAMSLVLGMSAQFSGSPVSVSLPASHTSLAELAEADGCPPLVVSTREVSATTAQNLTYTYGSSVQWITGGLHTVEITTGTQGYLTVFAFEYAGVVSSPFDKQASATGTGTAAATGSTGTLSTAMSLVLGMSAQFSGSPVSVSLPASHTSLAELAEADGCPPLVVSTREVSATTAQNLTYTYGSSVQWITGVATFTMESTWLPPAPQSYPPSRAGGGTAA